VGRRFLLPVIQALPRTLVPRPSELLCIGEDLRVIQSLHKGVSQKARGERWGGALTILAVPHVYVISYIGGVHVKAGVMALCVTFGLLHKIVPDDSEYLHTQQRTQDYHELT
jgi:hypothetical protein